MISRFRLGDTLRIEGEDFLVVGKGTGTFRLRSLATREFMVMLESELFIAGRVEVVGHSPDPGAVRLVEKLDGIADRDLHDARALENHIVEVETGLPQGAGDEATPRPGYDPTTTSLTERQTTKINELNAAGLKMSERTFRRKRADYQRAGLAGLVDARVTRDHHPLAGVDERLVSAIIAVIAKEEHESTGTRTRLFQRVGVELQRRHPDQSVPMPSTSSLYRYVNYLSAGKHTFGDSTLRRTTAGSPKRPYGQRATIRPGEYTQIDSTPLDVLALDAHGNECTVMLTILIDVASSSILGFCMRSGSTKAVDLSLLLARCLVPAPFRPGHEEQMKLTNSVLPADKMIALDERQKDSLAMPLIVPETITIDNGRDYTSDNFMSACAALGISVVRSSPYTPTDKGKVENTFKSINTLFTQYLLGYKGRAVSQRGNRISANGLHDILTLSDLFQAFVVLVWQNRKTVSLQDPRFPGVRFSPNEFCAAMLDFAPVFAIPIVEADYIGLLPVHWRKVHPDGIEVDRRNYDSPDLDPLRARKSSNSAHNGLWEVRIDPYAPSVAWVRDSARGGWIECRWRKLDSLSGPMANEAWREARRIQKEVDDGSNETRVALFAEILERSQAGARKSAKSRGKQATAEAQDQRDYLPRPRAAGPTEAEAPAHVRQDAVGDGRDLGFFDPESER